MPIKKITLENIEHSRHQLSFRFSADDLHFNTSYWYSNVNLSSLKSNYTHDFVNSLFFHIAAFELNKLGSLKPDYVDFGDYTRYQTREFDLLWKKIFKNVWAQWRYENSFTDYYCPKFVSSGDEEDQIPVTISSTYPEVLSFCGGGKDSLVQMKILEGGEIPFDSVGYSVSIYGSHSKQHNLLQGLIEHLSPENHQQQWIFSDFLESPTLELYSELEPNSLLAAETPSSIFANLPLALSEGYTSIVLGHERSADRGQAYWEAIGEEINHQWGKSYEAERLLNSYIQNNLLDNFQFYSVLKPIYDPVIFNLLRRHENAIPNTHSCNIDKPWCCRCPKCAYVWANYMAYLPVSLVNDMFSENLFDLPENHLSFRRMLGLEERLPFECIGQMQEARLAFELCRQKGIEGRALDEYAQELAPIEMEPILDKYLSVEPERSGIPTNIKRRIIPQMRAGAEEARSYVDGIIG